MPKAVLRIAKLKSGGAIAASESHVNRDRLTPNADLNKFNERFIGSPTENKFALEKEVFDRIGDNGGKKIRSDAVLCVEILLTASPEYFRPDAQGKAGKWDEAQLKAWKDEAHKWLQEKYGDRVVRAELHLDESTPHIHAYLVPLDEQEKLNCKSFFGDRKKLSELQDSYAESVSSLGLERGIKGSRATHTDIKDYYAAVMQEPDLSLSQEEMHHQLADRQRVLKDNGELEATARALASENELQQQQIRDLQIETHRQQSEAQKWKQKYQAQLGQLREILLTDVASELGFDPDPKDKKKWKSEGHSISITGSKFYDFGEMKGGGGAVDLVMHLERCSFGEAVRWLNNRFSSGDAAQIVSRQVEQTLEEKPRVPFTPPEPVEQNWQQVREYLTSDRKLPKKMIDALHDDGLIYADKFQNAVFLRESIEGEVTGANLRGTVGENNAFKGLAPGTRRTQGWFMAGSIEADRAVIVESPIDALSYAVLHPSENTIYLSTDGAGSIPVDYLRQIPEVILGFDRDEAGEAMAERIKESIPQAERHVPENKDWNEDLIIHLQQEFKPQRTRGAERGFEL